MTDAIPEQDLVHTVSVASGVARADDIVLVTAARTRTLFRPSLVSKGVRGHVIRQKIGADGHWADLNEVNFNSVPADCGVSIELDSAGTRLLFEELQRLYEVQGKGVRQGDHSFVVAPAGQVVRVRDTDAAAQIERMVGQGHSAEMWKQLADADPALADQLAAARLQVSRRSAILEFAASLETHPKEERYWQGFFEQNPWMLQCASAATVYVLSGDTYIGGKLPIGRGGKGGVATDFVTADASTKSFGVVEIKTPSALLVGPEYRNEDDDEIDFDNVVFSMHAELSGAVVQTRNQMAVAIEDFHAVLRRHPQGTELNRLHPKGILIVGTLNGLSAREAASFNQFRHGQNSLTILTFDELLRRLAITYEVELPDPG